MRPWAMAASIWGSWARVANGNNDIGGLTAIKTKMAEEIPVHKIHKYAIVNCEKIIKGVCKCQ